MQTLHRFTMIIPITNRFPFFFQTDVFYQMILSHTNCIGPNESLMKKLNSIRVKVLCKDLSLQLFLFKGRQFRLETTLTYCQNNPCPFVLDEMSGSMFHAKMMSLVYLRFCGKMLILCFNGSIGNSKKKRDNNLHKPFFMNYVIARVGNLLQYSICLKSELVYNYFSNWHSIKGQL